MLKMGGRFDRSGRGITSTGMMVAAGGGRKGLSAGRREVVVVFAQRGVWCRVATAGRRRWQRSGKQRLQAAVALEEE